MKVKKVTVAIVLNIILLILNIKPVKAMEEYLMKVDPDVKVLVVYSTAFWEMDENTRLLDLSIGHFSNDIEYRNAHDLDQVDIEEKTHIIYYGHIKDYLPDEFSKLVTSFDGPVMAIGYNVGQLGEKYSFLKKGGEKVVTKVNYNGEEDKTREIEPNIVFETTLDEGVEVLIEGDGEQGLYPLGMRKNELFYFASDSLTPPYSVYFSQMLNTFFDVEPIDKTPAYIRLEDVHPLSDPKRLKRAAEELKRRNIPYMIAVIPVYTDPVSGRRYHFEDQSEVLDILKYMQNNGGSVILHGYTHQFRQSETGEGFEFWDVENGKPVYHGPEEDVDHLLKTDFQNEEDYEAYMIANKKFERRYIEERLTRGVQELVNYGLYPLAFEAPHYTMSQHGYKVVSEYFSTYVGQIQLSDEDWEIMNTTVYASQPALLNGMKLLPETIGFVRPESKAPIRDMMEMVNYYQVADGGMIGAFYHPYLGDQGLVELLDEMEKIENIQWIDLKEMENTVAVDHITIKSSNGEIDVQVKRVDLMATSFDFLKYHIKETIFFITWIIAGIGITAVLMFISFTIYLKVRQRRLDRYASEHTQTANRS